MYETQIRDNPVFHVAVGNRTVSGGYANANVVAYLW